MISCDLNFQAEVQAKVVKQIDLNARMSYNRAIANRKNSALELTEAEEDSERIHTGLSIIGHTST
jgi:hypothetical protein